MNGTRRVRQCTTDDVVVVMRRYPHGISRKKVAELLRIKVTTLRRSWSSCRRRRLIVPAGYGTFVLSTEFQKSVPDFSLGTTTVPEVDLHALQISIPILEDKSKPEDWDSANVLKNWTAYIKRFEGFTVKKNGKTLQGWLWARRIKNVDEVESLAHGLVFKVATGAHKMGVLVDIDHARVTTKHIAIKKSELEQVFPKGTTVSMDLGRYVEKVFEEDKPEPAKAYTDASPYRGIETNDMAYARELLNMPLRIAEINKTLSTFAQESLLYGQEIREHREAIKEMTALIREMRDHFKGGASA